MSHVFKSARWMYNKYNVSQKTTLMLHIKTSRTSTDFGNFWQRRC